GSRPHPGRRHACVTARRNFLLRSRAFRRGPRDHRGWEIHGGAPGTRSGAKDEDEQEPAHGGRSYNKVSVSKHGRTGRTVTSGPGGVLGLEGKMPGGRMTGIFGRAGSIGGWVALALTALTACNNVPAAPAAGGTAGARTTPVAEAVRVATDRSGVQQG